MLVVDHAIALLLTHKLNMEDKHTKSLKSMKIFFTEKFFHARVMEKQSTARIINSHQIYRIQFEVKKVLLFAAIRAGGVGAHFTSYNVLTQYYARLDNGNSTVQVFIYPAATKVSSTGSVHCTVSPVGKSMHRPLIYKLCRLFSTEVCSPT